MERWVLQQTFPNWDSLRIMNARRDHLDWMHRHFADTRGHRLGAARRDRLESETDAESRAADHHP